MVSQEVTRQIFWGVPRSSRAVFYGLAVLAVAISAYGFYSRARRWLQGTSGEEIGHLGKRIKFVVAELLTQRTILRRRVIGVSHALMLASFCVLFLGTVTVTLEYDTPLHFLYGWFYLLFKATLDTCGLLMISGIIVATLRRYIFRPAHLSKPEVDSRGDAAYLLSLLSVIILTGYLVEGTRLAATRPLWSIWSPIGALVENIVLSCGLGDKRVEDVHFAFWWVHSIAVLLFIASIPFTGFKHIFIAPLQMFFRSARAKGALSTPFRAEDLVHDEGGATTTQGISTTQEFSWQRRLSFDACTSCGRCDDNCPALASGTALSPKSLILKLRGHMEDKERDERPLFEESVQRDEVMACTTCRACMEVCPVSIEHIDVIVDLRRHLLDSFRLSEQLQKTLTNIAGHNNPWGLPHAERSTWLTRLPARVSAMRAAGFEEAEVMYWVGCAASYDERANRVANSFLGLLASAGVKYAILGAEEKCNGELARRLGEEGLFQRLALENILTLKRHKVKKIVTTCPHCFNTLKNEYPDFGGDFEVSDHSTFLDSLIASDRLAFSGTSRRAKVTYHDPCYLGRHNDVYETPRSALYGIPGLQVVEMKRSRERSFCCGAGGANYWHEVPRKEKCENIRLKEALGTGSERLAVACPFCLSMFTEASRNIGERKEFEIQDVAEILAEHVSDRSE